MEIRLESSGDLTVSFKFRPVLNNIIKDVPGRRFNPTLKSWIIPAASRTYFESISNDIARYERINWLTSNKPLKDEFVIPEMPELTIEHGLKLEPKPYQANGIARGLELKRFMNADDPGLGKSFQTIGTFHIANAFPCLVVCPSSVKYHWQREWSKFTDRKAMVINDDLLDNWPYFAKNGYDVFIVNYESLEKYFVLTITTPRGKPMLFQHIVFKPTIDVFKSVIVDESHRCGDFGTQQTKFVYGIADGIAEDKEWKATLTGTPIVNNHLGLLPQLKIMGRIEDFGGERYYRDRYCAGPNKASNGRELRAKLWNTCFFRRTKAEVKKDLPALTREIIVCDITNRREYNLAQLDLKTYLKQYKQETDRKKKQQMKGAAFIKMNLLSQLSSLGKIKAIIEHIHDFQQSGKKQVVYCEHHVVVDHLRRAFPKAVCITGRQTAEEKQRSIDAFSRNQNVTLAICSAAAGTGTDGLQNQCSEIDLIEFPWHDAGCVQIESRLDRTGQKEPVTARYWQGMNTVDEKKWLIVQTKKKISETVMGSGEAEEFNENIVDMMAEMFNDEN